jgi:hypothetical protein
LRYVDGMQITSISGEGVQRGSDMMASIDGWLDGGHVGFAVPAFEPEGGNAAARVGV